MFNKVLAYIARETAQIAAVVAGLIQLLGALLLGFTTDEQGALNALVVVILGVLTSLSVSAEKAAPLLAGLVQALLAVALAFGFQLTPQIQSSVMVFVGAVVAFYLRTQVFAPVGPDAVSGAGRHVLS